MPKVSWQIRHYNGSWTDITSKVLSANLGYGREKYLDNYAGNTLNLTINNAANYAAGMVYGNMIEVISGTPGTEFYVTYWVQEVTYNDYPGGTGLNTATITAVDWMARAGRIYANALSLSQQGTLYQARQFENSAGGPLPADMLVYNYGLGDSIAPATTYSGSVNNYFNLLQATERGVIWQTNQVLRFVTRSVVSLSTPATASVGRTTSSTQIAYQEFRRIQNGTQFINTATIQPSTVAAQTVVNSTSVSTYGAASYSSATVDYTTTQAQGNGSWIANTFSDPAALRFQCSFLDVAQNATALASFMSEQMDTNPPFTLNYTVPGGSPTSVVVQMEGGMINITPESTEFTLFLSPLQYYQFFTLDSATLGILDTSRLGW